MKFSAHIVVICDLRLSSLTYCYWFCNSSMNVCVGEKSCADCILEYSRSKVAREKDFTFPCGVSNYLFSELYDFLESEKKIFVWNKSKGLLRIFSGWMVCLPKPVLIAILRNRKIWSKVLPIFYFREGIYELLRIKMMNYD